MPARDLLKSRVVARDLSEIRISSSLPSPPARLPATAAGDRQHPPARPPVPDGRPPPAPHTPSTSRKKKTPMDFSAALAGLQSRQANPETGDPAVTSAADISAGRS